MSSPSERPCRPASCVSVHKGSIEREVRFRLLVALPRRTRYARLARTRCPKALRASFPCPPARKTTETISCVPSSPSPSWLALEPALQGIGVVVLRCPPNRWAMPKSRGRKKPRKLPLPQMMRDALAEQRAAFRAKFGRDPGPNDPLIFDPDKDEPTPIGEARLNAEMLEAMRKAGVPPQIIYAYRKTGRLLLEGRRHLNPPEAQAEWDAAIDEYFRLEAQATRESPTPSKGTTQQPSATDSEFDAQSRHYRDNPAFKGILEFDLTIGWMGKQITRRARVDYEHTPEGEFYDLQKKELVASIVDQCMYSLHLQAVPEEFHDDGTITEGKPHWVKMGDILRNDVVPHEMWDVVLDAIEEKSKAEDAERRRRAAAK